MTSQVQDAYAAGFFDGEGCVIVSVSKYIREQRRVVAESKLAQFDDKRRAVT